MSQHTHQTAPFTPQSKDVIVMCDAVDGPANIGAIFRIADAFGVSELIFTSPPDLTSNRLKRTARNTEQQISYHISENNIATLEAFKRQGYTSVALEIAENSIPLPTLPQLHPLKVILVIGNEKNGVSDRLLSRVDHIVHIEMFGKNSSMNVAQATAIALYELTKH